MSKSGDQKTLGAGASNFNRPTSHEATKVWVTPYKLRKRKKLGIGEVYARCCVCKQKTKKTIPREMIPVTKVWCERCVTRREEFNRSEDGDGGG